MLSWEVAAVAHVRLGIPGAVVLLAVGLFGLSLTVEPLRRWRDRRRQAKQAAQRPEGEAPAI
jgi:hypothetical protein